MPVWFTADTHFGHVRIIDLCDRPFKTVEEMNETLVANWNERVAPEDQVFILGDLALGKLDDSLGYVAQLHGDKFLIPGNHDRVWAGYPNKGKPVRPEDTARYEAAGLTILSHMDTYDYLGQPWVLCHFPDEGDSHDEDRYHTWRPILAPDEVLVHGHVHNQWLTNGPRINVGVDVWDYRPVHEDEVAVLATVALKQGVA
jgi:calcineurin-like phosphoesterase family protein